ncbi:hypothetical protein V1514DRAFT_327445 [Lipomyces japonicus]|uniref:uncharacterized protein n=1 Tax=Lipomyces japonicus TaxID=56871 RepID=UPI0034CEB06D
MTAVDSGGKKSSSDAGTFVPFFSVTTLVQSCALTGTILLATATYYRFLRRVRTARDIPDWYFTSTLPNGSSNNSKRSKTLLGRVVHVGDGDNFRFFHTPGGIWAGWNWLRPVPFEQYWYQQSSWFSFFLRTQRPRLNAKQLKKVKSKKKKLSDETISVRLCGIDAPEGQAFGHSAQPHAAEAKAWLTKYVLGRTVRITPYSIDQYQRCVAMASVRHHGGISISSIMRRRHDVSSEMLKAGWAVVYESNYNSAFPASRQAYDLILDQAKQAGRGMWKKTGNKPAETPGEFKRRMRDPQQVEKEKKSASPNGKKKKTGSWVTRTWKWMFSARR